LPLPPTKVDFDALGHLRVIFRQVSTMLQLLGPESSGDRGDVASHP
jgi:hypothetical protein